MAAPYAAFSDSPEARAVGGALDLDTLVVAPAGNDGPAGPGYGSIASPGGAPDALTVGAADVRTQAEDVPVTVRTGLRLLLDRRLPLAGAGRYLVWLFEPPTHRIRQNRLVGAGAYQYASDQVTLSDQVLVRRQIGRSLPTAPAVAGGAPRTRRGAATPPPPRRQLFAESEILPR